MTTTQRDQLAHHIKGTCKTISAALEFLEMDIEESVAEDKLLDANVECCKGCGWWHDSFELDNEKDDEVGYCDQCAPKKDEDDA